jgi:hypothetical protein
MELTSVSPVLGMVTMARPVLCLLLHKAAQGTVTMCKPGALTCALCLCTAPQESSGDPDS